MPRVDATEERRANRRHRSTQEPHSRSQSASHTVKLEPEPTLIPEVLKITLPPSPHHDWRHPDELPYIRGGDSWDDVTILQFLTDNAFTIPPRSASSAEPWVRIGRGVSNREHVVLPRLYRTPLLWVAKFQWKSLELVLTADASIRQQEWDARKWDVLHIARLCVSLLDGARDAMAVESGGGMTRAWRHPPFDRALTRYWHRWLVLRDEFVRDFWRDYGEEEYRRDILKLGWKQWALKDHKGFSLTSAEILNGIEAAEFIGGLLVDYENGTFEWLEPDAPSDTEEGMLTPDQASPIKNNSPIAPREQDVCMSSPESPNPAPQGTDDPQPPRPSSQPLTESASTGIPIINEGWSHIASGASVGPQMHVDTQDGRQMDADVQGVLPVGSETHRMPEDLADRNADSPLRMNTILLSNLDPVLPEQDQPRPMNAIGKSLPAAACAATAVSQELATQNQRGLAADMAEDDMRENEQRMDVDRPQSLTGESAPSSATSPPESAFGCGLVNTNSPVSHSSTFSASGSMFVPPPPPPSPSYELASPRSPHQQLMSSNNQQLTPSNTNNSAEPRLLSLFTQSCAILGDEMRSLRTEVGMLRAEIPAVPSRVGEPRPQQSHLARSVRHPLHHLIYGEDDAMNGDSTGAGGEPARWGGGRSWAWGADGPLPPRSRGKQFKILASLPDL
ncbi:hypothetical protein C8J57DRAFT_1713299 [Mycena rebaudengoi]|nr:hypothetical protein C8J57DRAFT_1713299 [Mycena rebaudengoi]